MKTREQIQQEVLKLNANHLLLMLPTGEGKSKIALDFANSKFPNLQILVVYPKVSLKNNWIKEYKKWGYNELLESTTFTTYNSLGKHLDHIWDVVIFDEGHHITPRVIGIIKEMIISNTIILSATVKPSLKYELQTVFPKLKIYRDSMQNAIENGILPDPKVILLPLQLNVLDKTEVIYKNPSAKGDEVTIEFEKRRFYLNKTVKYRIPCTQAQYYLHISEMVDWYKRKSAGNSRMKNLWLHKAGDRLKWLANVKTPLVKSILEMLKDKRTLTFCATIEQTKQVGKNCIHSKNKASNDIIDSFNDGSINHITAVAMLDEGMNLASCQIGIFANINSSERIQIQRVGRILRHENPVIIIPYYINTREEEIVSEMIEGYNPECITKITNIKDLCQL